MRSPVRLGIKDLQQQNLQLKSRLASSKLYMQQEEGGINKYRYLNSKQQLMSHALENIFLISAKWYLYLYYPGKL